MLIVLLAKYMWFISEHFQPMLMVLFEVKHGLTTIFLIRICL